ncbi:hypothetical protein C2E21_8250 [Chlorella sorokiniana]|uniref:Uncharacterized protein n=1 Tax=Chlorella sorokiniana TaxID=3076 RepID=A0A2P6TF66_CHLSO|nr:hypothetical protein C2E21_8250 [Chlorella sorokiniana]|eukprot:PRW32615.1 hypothetical protein C2E21_8250 [Chlorella sorokiniana]
MTWLDPWWRRLRLLAAGACTLPASRFPELFPAFAEPQEGEWLRKFTADQAGLDAAVSLQTLLFPSLVARLLWDQARSSAAGGSLSVVDGLWLAGFLAWAPLLLWLSLRRPKAYLRWRTPLVLLSRLHRSFTFMRWAGLFSREAMGAGGEAGPVSRQAQLGLLLWRPTSLVSLLFTYLVPFRYTAPCALVMLGMALHGAAQQCAAYCRGSGVERAAVQLAPELVDLLRGWQRLPLAQLTGGWQRLPLGQLTGGAALAADGMCSVAESCVPPAPPTCSWDACRNSCIAVNAWVLTVLGTLLPVAVLWAVEERSRLRFQRQWLQLHRPSRPAPQAGGGADSGGTRGVSWLMLCLWLLFFAWAVWVVLDSLILR